jgi:hypothetical protein
MIGKILVMMVRMTVLAAIVGVGAAILVVPSIPDRVLRRRVSSPPGLVLAQAVTVTAGIGPSLLNTETSRLEELSTPGGTVLDMAGLSPWEEGGRRQLIGVGWYPDGSTSSGEASGLEILRLEMPGGKVLDRIAIDDEPLPNGPPCWLPGNLARILYPGADGRIYRLDFEGEWTGGAEVRPARIRPRELPWQCSSPGNADPFVSDLAWLEDDRGGRRLLASIRFDRAGAEPPSNWQLWWLELDRNATTIQAAGRLLETDETAPKLRRRYPTICRDAAGVPWLAYVATRSRPKVNELRVVPVRFDPGSEVPHARDAEARVLAKDCLLIPPAPTPDRLGFTVVPRADRPVETVRVQLPECVVPAAAKPRT